MDEQTDCNQYPAQDSSLDSRILEHNRVFPMQFLQGNYQPEIVLDGEETNAIANNYQDETNDICVIGSKFLQDFLRELGEFLPEEAQFICSGASSDNSDRKIYGARSRLQKLGLSSDKIDKLIRFQMKIEQKQRNFLIEQNQSVNYKLCKNLVYGATIKKKLKQKISKDNKIFKDLLI